MDFGQAGVLLLVGCVAGFLNVMAGGGSLITVPVMVFMEIPGPVANGTNRIAILIQNISAVITFFKKGFSDFRLSLSLSAMAIPGAVAGALMGTRLDGVWFNRTVALIMAGVMILMAAGDRAGIRTAVPEISRKRLIAGHALMVLAGFYGGFIQMGIGFIMMPILNRVLGMDLIRVNMHKVFIIGSYTVVALAVFASQVQILWVLGLCLAAGHALGGWFGAHLSVLKGERIIKIVLNSVLIIFIIKLLFF